MAEAPSSGSCALAQPCGPSWPTGRVASSSVRRIVGREQRPNTKTGTRLIHRLAESSDAHAIPQARNQMCKYLPIDTHRPEHSPSRLAALKGNPDFWQELGKTLAAFG